MSKLTSHISRHLLPHGVVLFFVLLLIFGLVVGTRSDVTYAGTQSWTLDADFDAWTRSNSIITADGVQLVSAPEGVLATRAVLPRANLYVPSVWDARDRPSAGCTNGCAYYFGGYNGVSYTNDIVAYNPYSNTMTVVADLPANIDGSSAVWDSGRNKAIVFGGYNGPGSYVTTIYEYDPVTQGVTLIGNLPAGISHNSAVWDPRDRPGAGCANGCAYIFGGSIGDGNIYYDKTLIYNPTTNTSSTVNLPLRMAYAASVWDPSTNTAYVFGGYKVNQAMTEIREFDPELGTFTTIANFSVARNSGVALWDPINEKAYYIAGHLGPSTPTNVIISFDSTNYSLTTMPTTLPWSAWGVSGFWDTNQAKAHVYGGYNGTSYFTNHSRYDPNEVYSNTGSATIVFTPSSGVTQTWESVSADTTLDGGTVALSYTTDTACASGFVSDIATLADSESVCIKAAFSATSETQTPSLDRLSVSYVAAPVATPTPAPTPTVSLTPTPIVTLSPVPTASPEVIGCYIKSATKDASLASAEITLTGTPRATARIYWDTVSHARGTSQYRYARVADYPLDNWAESPAGTTHVFTLDSLVAGMTYYFSVLMGDDTHYCEESFATLAAIATGVTSVPSSSPSSSVSPSLQPLSPVVESSSKTPTGTAAVLGFIALLFMGSPVVSIAVAFWNGLLSTPFWVVHYWAALLGLLGLRKRRMPWGRVVDSVSQNVLPASLVLVEDADNYKRVVSRTLTDSEGRYAFQVKPGHYMLLPQLPGYTFPSRVRRDVYQGDVFAIGKEGMIVLDLFCDPKSLNTTWIPRLKRWATYGEYLRIPLLLIGTVFSVWGIWLDLSFISVAILCLYIALWLTEPSRQRLGRHTLTVTRNGKTVPFAVIRLTKKTKTNRYYTYATNNLGEVFVLVDAGTYDVAVTTPDNLAPYRTTLKLSRGIIPRPITLDISK